MKTMIRLASLAIFLAAGCAATARPAKAPVPMGTNHPAAGRGDVPIRYESFRVSDGGEDLLGRCAEITVRNGFDYFVVVDLAGSGAQIRCGHGAVPMDGHDARAMMIVTLQK